MVETNIHYPTDDALICRRREGHRPAARRAKSFGGAERPQRAKRRAFRNRVRSAKRLALKIQDRPSQPGSEGRLPGGLREAARSRESHARQAGRVGALLGESPSARKLAEEISRFCELLEWAVGQARRRVLEGERLPAEQKLLSLFEEHTAIIRRGKARRQTEFGRKVWLSEVEGGIVSGFRIPGGQCLRRSPARADPRRPPAPVRGAAPLVAVDRSVHSKENERIVQEEYGVEKVCLPKAGKKSAEREEYERQGWYKRARRFRAGIEGRISVMARRGYLSRCRDRGEEGFGRWVGWGVLTANLDTIAQTLAAR